MIRLVRTLSVFLVIGALFASHNAHALAQSSYNVKTDCGAVGDGTADDTAAFIKCINFVNAAMPDTLNVETGMYTPPTRPWWTFPDLFPTPQTNMHTTLYIPAGIYLINGKQSSTDTTHDWVTFNPGVPGAVIGDGLGVSVIKMSGSFVGDVRGRPGGTKAPTGDLFSWTDTAGWDLDTGQSTDSNPRKDLAYSTIKNLSIVGTRTVSNPQYPGAITQNAIHFYDYNDFIQLEDVMVDTTNGYCFVASDLRPGAAHTGDYGEYSSNFRESYFRNFKCWHSGTTTTPAVAFRDDLFNNGDGANEVYIYDLDIFDYQSTGLQISHPYNNSANRGYKIFGLRIEAAGATGTACDAFEIGASTDLGIVPYVDVYDLDEPNVHPPSGSNAACYGVRVTNATGPATGTDYAYDYKIAIHNGSIAGGGKGVYLSHVTGFDFRGIIAMDGNGKNDVVLADPLGNDIHFEDGFAQEANEWRVDSSGMANPGDAQAYIHSTLHVAGLPKATAKIGESALIGYTNTATAVRLFSDGVAFPGDVGTIVANAQNCFNVADGVSYVVSIQAIAHDVTGAGTVTWNMPQAYFGRHGTPVLSAGTPTVLSVGTVGTAAFSLANDTVHNCLNVKFTPPASNTDEWRATARIHFTQVNE